MKQRIQLFTLLIMIAAATGEASAQKYVAKQGQISFFSDAAMEDIEALNKKVVSIFNASTGDIAFSLNVKDFHFDQSLMEEHFNEKYMESEKYPKSTFQGKITGFSLSEKQQQQVRAVGKLTIHGVTHDVDLPGTLTIADDKISMQAKFPVKLVDYKVEIPKLLWQKIAEEVAVTISIDYQTQANP
jgi:hypothetical protein